MDHLKSEGFLLIRDTGWRFLSGSKKDIKELREMVLLPTPRQE